MGISGKNVYELESYAGSQVKIAQSEPQSKQSWCKRRTACEVGISVLLVLSLVACSVLVVLLVQNSTDGRPTGSNDHGGSIASSQKVIDEKTSGSDRGSPVTRKPTDRPTDGGSNGNGGSKDSTTSATMDVEQLEVCTTADCVTAASAIIEAMDTAVDPCDDFFEYACANWNRENIIPDDRMMQSRHDDLTRDIYVQFKDLLEKPITDRDTAATSKAKTLYRSCMAEAVQESRGVQPMLDLLSKLGGWPMLNSSWDDSDFDLVKLILDVRAYGIDAIIKSKVHSKYHNSSAHVMTFLNPDLVMESRDAYLNTEDTSLLSAYVTYAASLAVALGADVATAIQDVKDMVDFEIYLAAHSDSGQEYFERDSVDFLDIIISDKFDWQRYLRQLLASANVAMDEYEDVEIYSPVYLHSVFEKIAATPNRVVANYIIWRVVVDRANDLTKDIMGLKTDYMKARYGVGVPSARWLMCADYTSRNVPMAVGRMYVEKHFDESSKADALVLIENIRKSFISLLDNVTWFDEETKGAALEKVSAIDEKVGYPEYILNNTKLDAEYERLQFGDETFFENVLEIMSENSIRNLGMLRKTVDKTSWHTRPTLVGATYGPTNNDMVFPAAVLQPPFYKKTNLKALNYGGIGRTMGHEITHGFDNNGRHFDKNGNFAEWWSESVEEAFENQTYCFVEQYGNLTIDDINMKVDGLKTLGENIADNGGLKQAFRAYRKWVEQQGKEEPRLPGMQQFTPNQLFFLSFGQTLCGATRPAYAILQVQNGVHSPSKFRVNAVVGNSPDFAKAFNCPLGSPMNPVNKCSVW